MKKILSLTLLSLFTVLGSSKLKAQDNADTAVFVVVEEQPQFRGGEKARAQYLIKEVKYPAEAVDKGIEGVVFVRFIVEKDGSLSNVHIIRGVHELLDQEALRVVQNMPEWKPGQNNGEAVRVQFDMPIRFKLDKSIR